MQTIQMVTNSSSLKTKLMVEVNCPYMENYLI